MNITLFSIMPFNKETSMRFLPSLFTLISSLSLTALPVVSSPQDIPSLFPSTELDVIKCANRFKIKYQTLLEELIQSPHAKLCYGTVFDQWDAMEAEYQYCDNLLDTLILCSPHPSIRDAAAKAQGDIKTTRLSLLYDHPEFYDILTSISSKELNSEKQYYFEQVKESLKKSGFHLSKKERERLKNLFAEMFSLEKNFQKNISDDGRHIVVSREQLDGLSPHIIDSLAKTKEGSFILTTQYPVYFPVQHSCSNEMTRKALLEVFSNRAYPHNKKILDRLIELRLEIAQTIGYSSYAEMELKMEMAKTPEKAHAFLASLSEKIAPKAAQESATLTANLPENVKLAPENKINEWDFGYIREQVKQNLYHVSSEEVAEYFPINSTIAGLIEIYESFFNVSIIELPIEGMWSDEVRVLQVQEKGSDFVHGYVLLDLYPRANKYSHACMVPLLPAQDTALGSHPATALLICNFPKGTEKSPGLLSHSDVITFFHEFGHGLHHLFGRTSLASASINVISADFVELPSQLLENWMWEKETLRKVSKHYITGLPLPDSLIDKMIASQNITIGIDVQRQCCLSFASLALYGTERPSDPNELLHSLYEKQYPHVVIPSSSHKIMSFSHLMGYGSRYYGYLWSRSIAADIFETIKKEGLFNSGVGMKYRHMVLRPAATKDPNEMVRNFLGREPSETPFLHRIGM